MKICFALVYEKFLHFLSDCNIGIENWNNVKRQEQWETKKDKYHSGNNKVKLIAYYDFHKERLQEQSRDYYKKWPEKEKDKKWRMCKK